MIIKIILALLGLTYVFSPYDLVPDFIVGLGWIDDIIILILLWKLVQHYNRRRSEHESYFRENNHASYGGAKDDRFFGNRTFGTGQQSREEGKQNDPHKVLGVGKNASPDDIKSAYKRLAAKYHPDKVAHLGEEFRVLAEKRFKEIQEAYQELMVNE
ncbi:MAG: DnaJ domain-containing protein [Pseudomonadota bacterium]